MSAGPGRWRRLAIRLLQHAASVLPPGSSAWATAMMRETDHIEDDLGVVLWAFGCLAAAYRRRLSTAWTLDARRVLGRCIACTAMMCVLCLGALNSAIGKTGPVPPVFGRTACNLPAPAPDVASRIECGTVALPRNYDQPGSGVFKLAVVVVRSAQQPALPDPVVYISGGPGAPLTKYADYQARHRCLATEAANAPGNSFLRPVRYPIGRIVGA